MTPPERHAATPAELRRLADEIESRRCTGLTARWYCNCLDWELMRGPRCPLHRRDSPHAEASDA